MSNSFPARIKAGRSGSCATPTPYRTAAAPAAWPGRASSNTYYWIDPARDVTGVLVTQMLPFADRRVLGLLDRVETAVYAGMAS